MFAFFTVIALGMEMKVGQRIDGRDLCEAITVDPNILVDKALVNITTPPQMVGLRTYIGIEVTEAMRGSPRVKLPNSRVRRNKRNVATDCHAR